MIADPITQNSPQAFAIAWLLAMSEGDLWAAWHLTDDGLRRALVQQWWCTSLAELPEFALWAGWGALVEDMSASREHAMWPMFDAWLRAEVLPGLPAVGSGEWGAAEATEPIGPGLEVICWVWLPSAPSNYLAEPTAVTGQRWTMCLVDDNWLVASFTSSPVRPVTVEV